MEKIAAYMVLNITWSDIIFSVLANVVSSFIFIGLLLFILRPKLKISPCIGKTNNFLDDPSKKGEFCFTFKIVNKSWFSAYDIKVSLSTLSLFPVKDGISHRHDMLQLRNSKSDFIGGFRYKWIKKDYGKHAMVFISYENLEEILKRDTNSVRIQITAKHSLTGLSKVFSFDYVSCNQVKEGRFSFGNNFEIC